MIETELGQFNLTNRQTQRIGTLMSDTVKGLFYKEGILTVKTEKELTKEENDALVIQVNQLSDDPLPYEIEKSDFQQNSIFYQTDTAALKALIASATDLDSLKVICERMAIDLHSVIKRIGLGA